MPRRSEPSLASEAFAMGELAGLMADPIFYGAGVPRGDGRLVLVLPGLFANDLYLHPLRAWLRRIGYRPVKSTLPMNAGCPQRLTERVEIELHRRMEAHPGPVALIGHSRGGILARAIAARLQEGASHLVLVGAPVGAILAMPDWAAASRRPPAHARVAEAATRARTILDPDCEAPLCGCPFPADLRRRLHRTTRVMSIFSRDDPVVPARACHIAGAHNVEVRGTHAGLVYNRALYRELAAALAG